MTTMRIRGLAVAVLAAAMLTLMLGPPASAQSQRNRISVIVDSSSAMLETPQFVTTVESCTGAGWNPCTAATGFNPTIAQELCNACVRDTIRIGASCASNWSSACRTGYTNCLAAVGQSCGPIQSVTAQVTTRGDGTVELPGCDLDGDGIANESRLFQTKEVLRARLTAPAPVDFALWRYAQVEGGQVCTADAQCPTTPGGASVLTCESVGALPNRCMVDADGLDGPTTAGFEGQCALRTWTGAPAGFTCAACDSTSSFDRMKCEANRLDQVRTGGTSPVNGSTVSCLPIANPQHRFLRDHGALGIAGSCDPLGGERLQDFAVTGTNIAGMTAWLDHAQPNIDTDNELRASGRAPIAATLRDLRASLLAQLPLDSHAPCRRNAAVLIVGGSDTCESAAAGATAAQSLQDLAFTTSGGSPVSGYDVPVYVIGFGVCPPGNPSCQARADLNAIAAAGGTGTVLVVADRTHLDQALAQVETLTAALPPSGGCADADLDGVEDAADNCPETPNADQLDTDGDLAGNACDADDDGDGLSDTAEASAGTNPLLVDTDGDGAGDGQEVNVYGTNPLDSDSDDDSAPDGSDNCRLLGNASQANGDADALGDACDNCPSTTNADQFDRGGIGSSTPDGVGDRCQNADFNQDGRVDLLDTVLLRRSLAGAPPPVDPRMPPSP